MREALELASVRDRRSLSNFIERAVIDALPSDLKKTVMNNLESEARRSPVNSQPEASR